MAGRAFLVSTCAQIGHQTTLQRYLLDVYAQCIRQNLPKLLPDGNAAVVNWDVVSARALALFGHDDRFRVVPPVALSPPRDNAQIAASL